MNKIANKIETDSEIQRTAVRESGGLVGKHEKINNNNKKSPPRHRQQYGDYQKERGWREAEEGEGGM